MNKKQFEKGKIMKKILLLFVLIVGCQQQNLTLTPKPEGWDSMTLEQRNEWSADELKARFDAFPAMFAESIKKAAKAD